MLHNVILGIAIPFIGTALGSACVFFMKKELGRNVQRALLGFAGGVMVAASIRSLLIPAMNQSADKGKWAFLPAFIGFWLGILFLLLLDRIIPHLHMNATQAEGLKSKAKKTTMMVLAVTLHNIPEGMAVGVVFAGLLSGSAEITAGGALALSIGIAIQNFPKGAIISMAAPRGGQSKRQGVSRRGVVRGGGADRCGVDRAVRGIVRTRHAVSAFVCRRRDGLRCRRRTHTRNVRGPPLQHRRRAVRARIHVNDDARCNAGIIDFH